MPGPTPATIAHALEDAIELAERVFATLVSLSGTELVMNPGTAQTQVCVSKEYGTTRLRFDYFCSFDDLLKNRRPI